MIKKYYFIYSITNLINGKIYVGFHSTNNINDDYMGSGIAINKAYKKYGKENFEKKILEYCNNIDWKKREIYWIEKLNTYKKGYNLTEGGEGTIGFKHLDETIDKIKKNRKGKGINRIWTDETLEKIRIGNLGKKRSIETREKIGKSKIGNKNLLGYKHSKESKMKMKNNHLDFTGENNPMFNQSCMKIWIEKYGYEKAKILESNRRKKLKESMKGKTKKFKNKKCPHCGKEGKGPNMSRYHFNNCKLFNGN